MIRVSAIARRLAEIVAMRYGTRFPIERGKDRLLRWCIDSGLLEGRGRSGLRRVRRNGFTFDLDLSDWVDAWVYLRGFYERDDYLEVMEAAGRVPGGGVAADIGGHIGVYTLGLARALGPGGRVHTFEPNPRSFRRLQAHVAQNDCRNVVLNQMALGASSGCATLNAPTAENTSAATLLPVPLPDDLKPETHQVGVRTLDDYCAEHGLRRLDIIKIDCQGYEPLILEGGRQTLKAFRPRLLVEFHRECLAAAGWSGARFLALLAELGYETFYLWRGRQEPSADGRTSDCNLHCVPRL